MIKELTHVDRQGRTRMVDVSSKDITKRTAYAEGRVLLSADALEALRHNMLKKGDAIETARLAGVMAAKKTADLIPLCHPIHLTDIDVRISIQETHVSITSEVAVEWKTGVEMEALTAVSVAALTIIDMVKAVDKAASIEGVRVLKKTGGRSGEYTAGQERDRQDLSATVMADVPVLSAAPAAEPVAPAVHTQDGACGCPACQGKAANMMGLRLCVLTVSDRCSRGEAVDTSGPALVESLQALFPESTFDTHLVPDEPDLIANTLRRWADDGAHLILTTGGTGLGPRDRTPEATARVIDREHHSLLDLARMRCAQVQPKAFLSRGIAGACGETMIVNLPGSRNGATETLDAISDILPHAIAVLGGADHVRKEAGA